jgi:catechol 2,3-dioxygenase-like lactoylglutathione lyase family enzyme
MPTMLRVNAFDHVVLNVRDVEIAAEWYSRILGMERRDAAPAEGGMARTSMMFGRNKINLRPLSATQEEWFTGLSPQPGSDDLCFLTELPPAQVADHFRSNGVEIALGPVIKQGARGDIVSVYVRDPDGNLIEVASYP